MSASDSDTPQAATPRIPPLPREEWTDAARDVFEFWGEPGARENASVTNSVNTYAQHPPLAMAYFAIGKHLMMDSTISPRAREIVTLRVAWHTKSLYEWHYHVGYALNLGMTLAEVGAIRDDPDAGAWDELDLAMLHATDELLKSARVAQPTWDVLARHYDNKQLMDLVFTIGHYVTTAYVLSSLGIEMESGQDVVGFDLKTASGAPVRARYKPGEIDDWQAANA